MTEPTAAAPAERPADQLTPEEAGAEVRQIRGNREHDFHHEGRPGFDAALKRVTQLSERAHASADQEGEPGAARADETTPRPNVFDDPHAEPQTAAELAQIPAPELDARSGLTWDADQLGALYQTAEREDLVPLIRDGLHVARALAAQPIWDPDDTAAELDRHWGRAAPSMWAFATEAWNLLEAKQPAIAADLTRRGIRYHPDFGKYLARVGERMVDATTPGGERRLRAKYAKGARDA